MATEYKLSYTASEIDKRLGQIAENTEARHEHHNEETLDLFESFNAGEDYVMPAFDGHLVLTNSHGGVITNIAENPTTGKTIIQYRRYADFTKPIEEYIIATPTKTSQLENDSGFITEGMLGGVSAVHTLPTDAKDGDMCLYAPQNTFTLADSGKRIYFDWEEFRKPVEENELTQLSIYYGFDNDTVLEGFMERTESCASFWIQKSDPKLLLVEAITVYFEEGILDTEQSFIEVYEGDKEEPIITPFNSIDELPLYFDIPEFNVGMPNEYIGNAYLFHTEYKLMKYRGGEWIEAVEVPTKTSQLENDSGFITEGGVPAIHTLPTDAKDGDMCLYAPQNTFTFEDSGKRIYIDWEEFGKPVGEDEYTHFGVACYNHSTDVVSLEMDLCRSTEECFISILRTSNSYEMDGFGINFSAGELDTENSFYSDKDGVQTFYNSVDELPPYIDIPEFDQIDGNGLEDGNAYLFHTEYKLMKYQGGEWIDGGITTQQAEDLEANTAARHTHDNKKTLDGLYCPYAEANTGGIVAGNPSKRLEHDGLGLRYFVDGDVITSVETTDNEITINLSPDEDSFGMPIPKEPIVIPLGVTQTEMQEYVAAAINGSLDEIEAMIDESGVLE